MKTTRNQYDFVCEPNSIRIFAEESTKKNRTLDVELQVNGKSALFGAYSIRLFTPEEAIEKIKIFCNGILMFTEDEIQDYVEEDRIMLALNAYRFLKTVRTKNGGIIWQRP